MHEALPLPTREFTRVTKADRNHTLRAIRAGSAHRVARGVIIYGAEPPKLHEIALGSVIAANGVACLHLAGWLHQFDGIELRPPFASSKPQHRSKFDQTRRCIFDSDDLCEVAGFACTSPLRTLLDLGNVLNSALWEQALESALRMQLVSLADFSQEELFRRKGALMMRDVLVQRGNVPATESLLETLAVQLFRSEPAIPTPIRQFELHGGNSWANSRVDFAFPEQQLLVELDGKHHLEQVRHDIVRQNLLVARTGWRVVRFTWSDICYTPKSTLRTMRALFSTLPFAS